MNKLKISLKEDGSISQFAPDFKIMRGSYRNILINLEVPRSLLLEPVTDSSENMQTGNNIRIGGIIHTVTGETLQTKRYELKWVKDYTLNGVEYALYQRRMPKEFTMWETDNSHENAAGGKLDMVINVSNWVIRDGESKMEEVAATDTFSLPVWPSAFLENAEEISSPSDFDELQSQVQNMARDYNEFKAEYQETLETWYSRQQAEFQALIEQTNQNFTEMREGLEEQFNEEFTDLNRRMNSIETASLIQIEGQNISETDLMNIVQGLPDGNYAANTEQFGNEVIMIAKNNELIARYTATGASYMLDRDIMDWVMSAGGGGGGSGGGSGSTVRLTALSSLQITTAVGAETILAYNFKSNVAGKGTVKVYVNNALKATTIVNQGNNTFDATSFVASGSTTIRLTVTDTAGTSASLEFMVEGVELRVSSPFNDSLAYTGDIEFRYSVTGETEKTVHISIDGTAQEPIIISSTRQQTFTIPALSHGLHTVSIYAEAEIGGMQLVSNQLDFKVIAYEAENNEVIISSKFNQTEALEGDVVAIDYIVFDPANPTATVDLSINGEVSQTLSVGRTKQYWYIRTLAVGENTLAITVGTQSVSFNVNVTENEFSISAVEENLELYLSAYGRSNNAANKDVWAYGDTAATFTNLNWSTNGWIDNALRLNGAAQVTIPFKIFENDFRTYGKTIEFEFAARDVATIDTLALVTFADNIGIKLKMNEASIQSEQTSVNTKYKDDEKIRLSFVIDSKDGLRLIKTFVNGVISGISQYPANDNFQQSNPVGITINPEGGSVDIYTIRVYDTALSNMDMLNNYMADMDNLSDQITEFNKNNIFNNGEVSYDKVKGKIATVLITGSLPTVKGDKKTAKVTYENPLNISRNFETTATVDVQGTSSQYYPRKNFKIKLPEAIDFFGNGLREKTYTIKVNYMESGNRNNTGIANFVQGENGPIYSEPVPPQEDNENIRTVIKGEPIALFHKATESSTPKFYAIGQFNNDKGNANTLGLIDAYPNAESWEFKDNDELLCLFRTNDFTRNANAFEARYPEDNTDFTQIDALVSWVYSTRNDVTTFKNEFEDHFNLHYTMMYYLITEAFGMIDSRAKNLFLNTWDGQIWFPVLYDMDTAFGLNNEGVNNFSYNIEYNDSIGSQNVYNGSTSVLWNNFKLAYADEIKALYQTLRSSGKMSPEAVISALDAVTSDFSKALYNIDAENKYIAPLEDNGDATYLYCAQGDRREHLKWWLDKRFKYLDSKYYASEYASDYISMRIYSPASSPSTSAVPFNGSFTLKSFIALYMGVRYGANGTLYQTRANAETNTTISATNGTDLNDKETYIYGASKIKELGDLSNKYPGTVDVSKATQLTKLKVGNSNSNYSNTNLTELRTGNNKLLRELDVRNCPNFSGNLDVSGCENIQTIHATGTSVSSITLAEGGNLTTLTLPNTITNLTLKNQPLLTGLTMAGVTNVATLVVENCNPAVNTVVNNILTNSTALSRVRLINIDWSLSDKTLLDKLMACGGIDEHNNNVDNAIITGKVHITAIGQGDLDIYRAYWPNLTITYDTLIEQFTVTFVNWDGTVLDVQLVDKAGAAKDPISRPNNPIPTPTRERDAQYTYTYSGWGSNLTGVYSSRTITAQFSTTINSYTVSFHNNSSGTDQILYTVTANYGTAAKYVGNTPTYAGSESGEFLFGGWTPAVTNITGDTEAYAIFNKLEVPATVKALADCSPAEIKAIGGAGAKNASNQWVIGEDVWFEIGDEIPLHLLNGETLTLQIADFSHDVDSNEDTIPFTFVTKELLATSKKMNSTSTNAGGWSNSEMYSYIQGTVWDWIPDEWKMVITPAVKKSTEGNQSSTILSSTDNLFLLSYSEVGFGTTAPYGDEGSKYPIFTNDSSRVKKKVGSTSGTNWWLRSPYSGISTYFWYVISNGDISPSSASNERGVCFAFCV